jgi:hypothetical protein
MIDEHSLPGEPANRGWNRASIVFWSRKPYRPRVRRGELALPVHLSGLRLLLSCLAPAFCLTAFAVWTPLFFVSVFAGLSMDAFVAIMGGAFVAVTCALYVWVARSAET